MFYDPLKKVLLIFLLWFKMRHAVWRHLALLSISHGLTFSLFYKVFDLLICLSLKSWHFDISCFLRFHVEMYFSSLCRARGNLQHQQLQLQLRLQRKCLNSFPSFLSVELHLVLLTCFLCFSIVAGPQRRQRSEGVDLKL